MRKYSRAEIDPHRARMGRHHLKLADSGSGLANFGTQPSRYRPTFAHEALPALVGIGMQFPCLHIFGMGSAVLGQSRRALIRHASAHNTRVSLATAGSLSCG